MRGALIVELTLKFLTSLKMDISILFGSLYLHLEVGNSESTARELGLRIVALVSQKIHGAIELNDGGTGFVLERLEGSGVFILQPLDRGGLFMPQPGDRSEMCVSFTLHGVKSFLVAFQMGLEVLGCAEMLCSPSLGLVETSL